MHSHAKLGIVPYPVGYSMQLDGPIEAAPVKSSLPCIGSWIEN